MFLKFIKGHFLLVVVFLQLVVISCKIDTFPETQLVESDFWKTEDDFKSAANQLYAQLGHPYQDLRADDIMNASRISDLISSGTRVVPATSWDWTGPYRSIFTANRIIQNGNSGSFNAEILRYVSEARFFRCYYYYMLLAKYGDIPLMDRTAVDTKDQILFMPKTSRDSVARFIYNDLDKALEYLPNRSQLPDHEFGRVTKSMALGLKARVALYEGTRAKFHSYPVDYLYHLKVAYESALEVMESNEHELYSKGTSSYYDLFQYEGEGPANKENIFVKIYGYPRLVWLTHNVPYFYAYNSGPSRNFLNLYSKSDGTPYVDSPTLQTRYNDYFSDRDPRLKMSVLSRGESGYENIIFIPFRNRGTAFGFKKMVPVSGLMDHPSTKDLILMRYAEILLIYAEAKYEHDGSISNADLNLSINKLRDRVNFVRLSNEFINSKGMSMRNEIRRERSVELAFEGFRFDDIMRWKIAEDVLPIDILGAKYIANEWHSNVQSIEIQGRLTQEGIYIVEFARNRYFDPDRDYLYPIPYNDIASSRGALIQNLNW